MIFQINQKELNCTSFLQKKNVLTLSISNFMFTKPIKTLVLFLGFLASTQAWAQTLDEAIKSLDAERFTAANKAFGEIAKSSPTPLNHFYKGYALLRSPEASQPEIIKEATDAFTAGNALDKKGDPLNQVGLGMAKLAGKDPAGAKLIFDEVKKATKLKNTDVLYRIAEAYTLFPAVADAAEAIMNINMALEKSKAKDNPEYYIIKADAYMLKNEGGDAMNALQNAERLGKKLGRIYEKMSKVWLQSRNYKEADASISKGITAEPTHAPIYKYQSSYLQTMGKFAESAAAAKKYLTNSDGDCKAQVRYAKLAFVSKAFDDVLNTISSVRSCSKDPYLDRMTGIINFEKNNPTQAINDINKFIDAKPEGENFAMDYGYIGRSYLAMSGDVAAKKNTDSLGLIFIEKAIQLGDTSFNYLQDAANIFYKNKNYAKAAIFSERNINNKKSPNAADFATVGNNFYAAKDWAKAQTYVEKALGLYNDKWIDGFALLSRIKTFKNSKDSVFTANYGAAADYELYLQKLGEGRKNVANKRNVTEALTYLAGKEYLLNKDNAKAIAYLEEIVQLDPSNEKVKGQIDAIKGVVPPAPAAATPAPAPPATSTPAVPATKPAGKPLTKPAGKVK
jgi:hypothetical protein